ncbi:uncharacterized protein G2W53_015609 [Senna tora]|uniref:Uncharacterized protein n=1 Tax=Senna tora TaxID=362788 RepID=A0A835C5N0_9FABA|nr:uncharacterized protein G2W53_015609 [Senna tora]
MHRGSRKRRPRFLPHREREERNPNSQFEAEITGQRRGFFDHSEAEQQQQCGNQEEQWQILEDREIVQEEERELGISWVMRHHPSGKKTEEEDLMFTT